MYNSIETKSKYADIKPNKFSSSNNANIDTKSYEMQMLEEKLAWKQKISEQELELKRLKLQMMEQQNDQKTTLQYLLKLQTDFTQQIYHKNQNTNTSIRRPLSGLQPRNQNVSVQSSLSSFPSHVYEQGNITKAPISPQTPQPETFLQQVQLRLPTPQHIQPLYHNNYHRPQTKLSNHRSPQESPHSPLNQQNTNYSWNVPATQPHSSYFPMKEFEASTLKHISYPPPTQQVKQRSNVSYSKSQSQSTNISHRTSPNKCIEEQKQQSILLDDCETETQTGFEASTSMFLPISG